MVDFGDEGGMREAIMNIVSSCFPIPCPRVNHPIVGGIHPVPCNFNDTQHAQIS